MIFGRHKYYFALLIINYSLYMIYIYSMSLGTMWSNKSNKIGKTSQNTLIFSNKIANNKIIKNAQNAEKNTNTKIIRKDNRSYWGTPTWFLFHTIAEKIDSNYYNNNYMIIWNFIKDVCSNLPCPYCKNHAVNFIKSVNIVDIKTKGGLKKVLFNFHNIANKNSNKKKIDISVLNKYKYSNVSKIFSLFEKRFFHSYIGTRQFTDWIKNSLKIRYKEFIDKIKDYI